VSDDDLDRLTLQGLGKRAAIEGPAPFVEAVDELLPKPAWAPSTRPAERVWRAERAGDRLLVSVDGEQRGVWEESEAARHVRSDIEIWAAAHADGCVVVHACVVAHRGAALVLPGPSMAGKTTMAVALIRAGAEYCSDEFAVLDDRGFVRPYPRRPAVRRREPLGVAVDHVDPAELGSVCRAEVPVRLVADLRYAPGGANLEIEDMTPARTALSLMANAVAARTRPERVLVASAAAATGARGVVGRRGEADEAAGTLLELMSSIRDRRAS